MSHTTVKGALLLAGLTLFAGSVSALSVNLLGRHVLNPREVILVQDARLADKSLSQLIGHIDADVLNFRSDNVIHKLEEL